MSLSMVFVILLVVICDCRHGHADAAVVYPAFPLPVEKASLATQTAAPDTAVKSSQGAVTYTALRGHATPRFLPLPEPSHG